MLSLSCYLSSSLGFQYLLAANLIQDKMENVFGIVIRLQWSSISGAVFNRNEQSVILQPSTVP